MSVYPQLSTGAVTQYPVSRQNSRRTVVNLLGDGRTIRMADTGASMVGWQLGYSHLTLDELNGLLRLYDACYGQWQTFLFLDPTSNLLLWSEDQSQPVWAADPLLSVLQGRPDPLGGTSAAQLTNGAQVSQRISQQQTIPGTYQYCLSLYLQAAQDTPVEIFASSGTEQAVAHPIATSGWQRTALSFQFSQDGGSITVGIQLNAGVSVSVFGVQLEAQPAPGGYKRTRDLSGVYPECRFGADVLQWTATGVNQYACQVELVSNSEG